MSHRLSQTFGKQRVEQDQRQQLVRSVFKRVASRYDLMNDLMSMGVHRLWKSDFCRQVNQEPGSVFVDLAGGTGDIAAKIRASGRDVIIVDPGVEMMQVAKQRLGDSVQYIAGTAEDIPLPDASVDVVTISFGIRNATDVAGSLREVVRVLKPGGKFYCLEFSTPDGWLRPFYERWNRIVIPRLGALIAGHPDAYHYLIESIREFPDQEELKTMFEDAGLNSVSFRNVSFGIACIHQGSRPA